MLRDINRQTVVTGGTKGLNQYTRLKAVHLAILNFAKFKLVQKTHVHMDNKVVLCYLVKIGALTIRTSLIFPNKYEKKITINAECLPGHLNVRADWESHNFQGKSDWKLSPEVFAKIC